MFRQFFESDDGKTPAFMAQFPDELKQNTTLAQYKTLGDMGKAFLELHGKAASSVQVPGADAKPEEVAAFYDRIGRPKTVNDYKFDPVDLPKGEDGKPLMQINENLSKSFLQLAHEHGLTNKQAAAMYKLHNDTQIAAFTAQKQAQKDAIIKAGDALKAEWKDNFGANMEIANRAFTAFGGEEFAKYMNESGHGNDPRMMKTFLAIGKAMMDDKLVAGEVKKTEPEHEKGVLKYKDM